MLTGPLTSILAPIEETRVRKRLRLRGIVQGVGFRPFVFNLAEALGLAGFVSNDADGVALEVEGMAGAVNTFVRTVLERPPPLARIDEAVARDLEPNGEEGFWIVPSEVGSERTTLVSPDVATCEECLAELLDPAARRFRYAFTNCTNCGPRFTITRDVPYDRPNTTMAGFPMCGDCEAEYLQPRDRRFHAQPIACPACGPRVWLTDKHAAPIHGDPFSEVARLLASGRIVAIKGLGGYHLACDAASEQACSTLRSRKHREDKPFALMAADLDTVGRYCVVGLQDAELLSSRRRPIVLLTRLPHAPIAPSIAPGNRHLGFMLPYTPMHYLLLDELARLEGPGCALVMTSGNLSDEPIAHWEEDAYRRLQAIADYFLVHDREIHIRCDDSVTRTFRGSEYPLRRARGYAPEPLRLALPLPRPILAVGSELKHTFCLAKHDRAFLSHHIGDLENWETMRSFLQGVEHFARIFEVRPEIMAHDLHPEYLSTKWALEQATGESAPLPGLDLVGITTVGVQHHHAHIASCLVDNGVSGPVIGLALDGTGWGDDATVWGCEVLVADFAGYRRAGHLRTVPLPGGAAAIKEPWRMAAVYLAEAYGRAAVELPLPFLSRTRKRWDPVLEMARRGVNAPLTSSAGRLFDAVAALVGIRDQVNYEGQAAIELEQVADPTDDAAYECPVGQVDGKLILDGVALVQAVAEDLKRGASPARVSVAFHRGLARGLVASCREIREETGLGDVALSGGTFQNLMLLGMTVKELKEAGFTVYLHRRVPPNDGGIALGQVAVAARRAEEGKASPTP